MKPEINNATAETVQTGGDQAVVQERLVQRLLGLLDRADDLLSIGDVLLDGWPAAREWHDEYEKLPPGDVAYLVRGPDGIKTINEAEKDELLDAVFSPLNTKDQEREASSASDCSSSNQAPKL